MAKAKKAAKKQQPGIKKPRTKKAAKKQPGNDLLPGETIGATIGATKEGDAVMCAANETE